LRNNKKPTETRLGKKKPLGFCPVKRFHELSIFSFILLLLRFPFSRIRLFFFEVLKHPNFKIFRFMQKEKKISEKVFFLTKHKIKNNVEDLSTIIFVLAVQERNMDCEN